jgi:8-oxo-dGTP pyrophosphatase MutT (NUDIX family)
MSSIENLLKEHPNTPIVSERYELDDESFQAQKMKHLKRNAEGGAIGVVWLDKSSVVLARRTQLHPGWSLIGGTVEKSQDFEAAFIREVEEETGLSVEVRQLIMLEKKLFVSPVGEKLPMDLAVFEAFAKPNQTLSKTHDAEVEGLEVEAFDVGQIPAEMIMKDREKLELILSSAKI